MEAELAALRDERDMLKVELFRHYGVGQTTEPLGSMGSMGTKEEDLKSVSGMLPSWPQMRHRLETKRRHEAEILRGKKESVL